MWNQKTLCEKIAAPGDYKSLSNISDNYTNFLSLLTCNKVMLGMLIQSKVQHKWGVNRFKILMPVTFQQLPQEHWGFYQPLNWVWLAWVWRKTHSAVWEQRGTTGDNFKQLYSHRSHIKSQSHGLVNTTSLHNSWLCAQRRHCFQLDSKHFSILFWIYKIDIAKLSSTDSSCFLYQISDQTEGYGADRWGGSGDQPCPFKCPFSSMYGC